MQRGLRLRTNDNGGSAMLAGRWVQARMHIGVVLAGIHHCHTGRAGRDGPGPAALAASSSWLRSMTPLDATLPVRLGSGREVLISSWCSCTAGGWCKRQRGRVHAYKRREQPGRLRHGAGSMGRFGTGRHVGKPACQPASKPSRSSVRAPGVQRRARCQSDAPPRMPQPSPQYRPM